MTWPSSRTERQAASQDCASVPLATACIITHSAGTYTPHDVYPLQSQPGIRKQGNIAKGAPDVSKRTGQIMVGSLTIPSVRHLALRAKDQHQATRLAKRHVPLTSSPHPRSIDETVKSFLCPWKWQQYLSCRQFVPSSLCLKTQQLCVTCDL
ncbi:hypothetical protein LY78DRAFT_278474 [Colletotrichum sublineola]|nr:hypothetical protein LY78DRAFT_278474 [Colletotrichum sublineola]